MGKRNKKNRRHQQFEPRPNGPVELTLEQKMERRRIASNAMSQRGAIWMGDCSNCLLPLDYVPIKVPRPDSFQWTEIPGQVDVVNDYFCFECVFPAVREYAQIAAQGLMIRGRPATLDKGGS